MINFIGMGSAFNTELGNTSAFVKKENSLLLIDAGGTVFHRLQELNMFDGVENLYIVITHTHPDHVGSLGEIIFYSYYILKRIPTLFFLNKVLIKAFLTSIGVSPEMYKIKDNEKIEVTDEYLGKFYINFLLVNHVDTIPAYGFIMKLNEEKFYYSGDANNISSDILNRIIKGEIDEVYQDTCGLDYEGNNHLSLIKLCSIVKSEFRNKFYCMHLDKHITKEEIKAQGFNVVDLYK